MENHQWLSVMAAQLKIKQTLDTNQYTQQFGLILSQDDAKALAAAGAALQRQEERLELGQGILPRIIHTFCDSPYLNQQTYVAQLIRLQEIFYRYKNETDDELSDEELLHFMKEQFDGVCYGDLDYLEGTCLELFSQAVREGYRGYIQSDGYGEFDALDEVPRWDRALYMQALRRLSGWED